MSEDWQKDSEIGSGGTRICCFGSGSQQVYGRNDSTLQNTVQLICQAELEGSS